MHTFFTFKAIHNRSVFPILCWSLIDIPIYNNTGLMDDNFYLTDIGLRS